MERHRAPFGRERKLDGRQEAHLIAFACSAAPEGHTHWTLQLLADTGGGLEFAEGISLERCARHSFFELKPWKKKRSSGVPQGERGVRGADGGRAGPYHPSTIRSVR